MAKRDNLLPNKRVDIPDYKAQTSDFLVDSLKSLHKALILDKLAAVVDGFRVEIADQTTSPGLVTVYNGFTFDRDGQIIENDNDLNASRSITFNADATYYLEVEFIETESDVDARAFWDPDFDNGTDASGDTLPDGREFQENVATRLTGDWQIVQPVNTTEFTYVSTPGTNKVPIAVITVSGGVVSGGTTDPLRTIVAEDITALDTSISLVNTRNFPDTGTLQIAPGQVTNETVTIASNDRENGILSLSGAVSNSYSAGTRVVMAGTTPAEFLIERRNDTIPSSGTEDARPRLYQADEDEGWIVSRDPDTVTTADERSDLEVKSLKQYVNFLAAQIREMKFGSAQTATVGDLAPPNTFAAAPKYYDPSGGLVGGKGHTVSVGDGVNSWGDFNTTQSGSAQAAIQAAYDYLQANNGGILYLKHGTYTITTTALDFGSGTGPAVTIQGDGRSVTTISAGDAGGTEAIQIGDPGLTIKDLTINVTGTAAYAVTLQNTNNANTSFYNCSIEGINANVASEIAGPWLFANCKFISQSIFGGSGTTGDVVFRDCEFEFVASETALEFSDALAVGNPFTNITLDGCVFTQTSTNISFDAIALMLTDVSTIVVSNCKFIDCDTSIGVTDLINFTINNNVFDCPTVDRGVAGIANVGVYSVSEGTIADCVITNLDHANAPAISGIIFDNASGSYNNVAITGNVLKDIGDGTTTTSAYGIHIDTGTSRAEGVVNNNVFESINSASGDAVAVFMIQFRGSISNNSILNIGVNANVDTFGIKCQVPTDLTITGNSIVNIGNNSASGGSNGGVVLGTDGSSPNKPVRMIISNNDISGLFGLNSRSAIIILEAGEFVSITGNVCIGTATVGSVIHVGKDGADGGDDNSDIVISGNIVEGGTHGILVNFTEFTTNDEEGRVAVTGNLVRQWGGTNGTGIFVSGSLSSTGTTHHAVVVSGNSLFNTRSDGSAGIKVLRTTSFSISGNTVYMSDAAADFGIQVSDHSNGSITGNTVDMAGTTSTAKGIDTTGTGNVIIAGNFVQNNSNTNPTIDTGDFNYVAANYVNNGGTGADITLGASSFSEARADSDGGGNPSALTDVGLNYRP